MVVALAWPAGVRPFDWCRVGLEVVDGRDWSVSRGPKTGGEGDMSPIVASPRCHAGGGRTIWSAPGRASRVRVGRYPVEPSVQGGWGYRDQWEWCMAPKRYPASVWPSTGRVSPRGEGWAWARAYDPADLGWTSPSTLRRRLRGLWRLHEPESGTATWRGGGPTRTGPGRGGSRCHARPSPIAMV